MDIWNRGGNHKYFRRNNFILDVIYAGRGFLYDSVFDRYMFTNIIIDYIGHCFTQAKEMGEKYFYCFYINIKYYFDLVFIVFFLTKYICNYFFDMLYDLFSKAVNKSVI